MGAASDDELDFEEEPPSSPPPEAQEFQPGSPRVNTFAGPGNTRGSNSKFFVLHNFRISSHTLLCFARQRVISVCECVQRRVWASRQPEGGRAALCESKLLSPGYKLCTR